MADTDAKKILVVEDEKAYARALVLKLEHEGFGVDNASDGQEALSMLEKNGYDLVLLDLVMPKINGFGVLQEMKNRNMQTPVMVLSNLIQEEDKNKVKAFGVVEFIEKSDTTIADAIAKVVHFVHPQ